MLYEAALREKRDRVAIGAAVERDGQVEIRRIHTNSRASDRNALRVPRELEWPFDQTVKKGPDHANRLAAVVERRRQGLPAIPQLAGDLLDLRPRGYEHGDTTTLPQHALYEALAQEFEGFLGEDLDVGGLGR